MNQADWERSRAEGEQLQEKVEKSQGEIYRLKAKLENAQSEKENLQVKTHYGVFAIHSVRIRQDEGNEKNQWHRIVEVIRLRDDNQDGTLASFLRPHVNTA